MIRATMAARIYPFPGLPNRFLGRFAPPKGDNFTAIFAGGFVAGAIVVALVWCVSLGADDPPPTVSPAAAASFAGNTFDACIDKLVNDAEQQ